jgi:hypothetical protein
VVRKFALYLGVTHGYMCQIVFIDFSGGAWWLLLLPETVF